MERIENKPDLILFFAPITVFFVGLFYIYSSSWREGQPLDETLAARQFMWMMIAIVLMLISLRFHYRILLNAAWLLYGITLFLLVIVLFTPARLGAHRWIDLGFFSLQPSELAKVSVVLALATLMKDREYAKHSKREYLWPFIVTGIPMLLIMKEPDLGTALVFVPILFAMLYVSGFKMRWIMGFAMTAVVLSPILYSQLKTYQKLRILTFLNPDRDPLGSGYTIIQSKIAIGSGGFFGKGFLSGSQTQLHFLPESHTDFIFSVVGEEGGFIATSIVLIAYWLIAFRGLRIAQKCANRFGKLLAIAISMQFAFQSLVNMSMTMGILPVVGMPLFFVSYGGSSLVVSMFLIGILMNIGMRRDPFL